MTTEFSVIKRPIIRLLGFIAVELLSAGTLVAEETWDKTFLRSEKVTHQKVTFKNRYGITLAADLYEPKDRGDKRLAAIAVSGPFGAVKEQSSGLYAQTMAERGFVTLAFDPSYTGESGGEPRHVASPDINTEDFSAAVDFSACNLQWTASASASLVFAAGAVWRSMRPPWTSESRPSRRAPCTTCRG